MAGSGAVVKLPFLVWNPGPFDYSVLADGSTTDSLAIRNAASVGSPDLTWAVVSAIDCMWLSLLSWSGVVPAGESGSLVFQIDATGLEPGIHSCFLTLATNDPDAFLVPADLTLTVEADCNSNGVADSEEIHLGAPDIDGDGILDECEPTSVLGLEQLVHRLSAAVPNPFNPSTTIAFDLSEAARVELTVFDVVGRRVRTLLQESRFAGNHEVTWNGRDETGQPVASGVYLYELRVGSYVETRRMTLLK